MNQESRPRLLPRLSPHLRGHLFLFDRVSPPFDSRASVRLLVIFFLLEIVIGPRLWLLQWLQAPQPPQWIRVPGLLIVALVLVRVVGRLKLSEIGLRRWRDWSTTERSYFVQVVILGNAVFLMLFGSRLKVVATNQLWGWMVVVALVQLCWGMYQELMYRGILQTALVSRMGPLAGILVANTLFTLGPLHFYHLGTASAVPVLAGVFAIGLVFSIVFWRSGNLWIVGLLHGIGNFYIEGLRTIGQ